MFDEIRRNVLMLYCEFACVQELLSAQRDPGHATAVPDHHHLRRGDSGNKSHLLFSEVCTVDHFSGYYLNQCCGAGGAEIMLRIRGWSRNYLFNKYFLY